MPDAVTVISNIFKQLTHKFVNIVCVGEEWHLVGSGGVAIL